MSADLQPAEQFVNPTTGEVLTLASPDADLGHYLADIRDLESILREHKKIVTRELLSRMDRSASWTVYADGVKLSGASPKPTEEFNGPALHEALSALVDEGVLTVEAVDAAVETVVTYEPRKRGINSLRALGGRVKEIVDAHATEVTKDRRITVSRAA